MTAGPVRPPVTTHARPDLGQWAVRLAAAVTVVVAATSALLLVSYAVGGDAAISDNWVGYAGAAGVLGGLFASLVAFLMALIARRRHAHRDWLWLPLALFPALLAFVVLSELFWLE